MRYALVVLVALASIGCDDTERTITDRGSDYLTRREAEHCLRGPGTDNDRPGVDK